VQSVGKSRRRTAIELRPAFLREIGPALSQFSDTSIRRMASSAATSHSKTVYVSAAWDDAKDVAAVCEKLEAMGFKVTRNWAKRAAEIDADEAADPANSLRENAEAAAKAIADAGVVLAWVRNADYRLFPNLFHPP
jgi:hypothetical protein